MVPELVYDLNKMVAMALGTDLLLLCEVLANGHLWYPSDHLCVRGW